MKRCGPRSRLAPPRFRTPWSSRGWLPASWVQCGSGRSSGRFSRLCIVSGARASLCVNSLKEFRKCGLLRCVSDLVGLKLTAAHSYGAPLLSRDSWRAVLDYGEGKRGNHAGRHWFKRLDQSYQAVGLSNGVQYNAQITRRISSCVRSKGGSTPTRSRGQWGKENVSTDC